ncbi:tetratricopeptide repeat-containing diguanylate cyclase [Clostridioides sp. GD02377]|uniref:tetratricopeptide repeat-containing diguanylate cyclase n=1 Tax=unclassified Clostridioides TaxID=2635829 RepID=UPI0038ACCB53
MNNYNVLFEQIQLIIERIQHRFEHSLRFNKHDCDRLLTISEQLNCFYGQALAHVYLAQYFQMKWDVDAYNFHSEKARELAENKNYFDVLIEYFKIEGLRNITICDEIAALTIYLKGIQTAYKIKDKKSCAIFYNNIADILYTSGVYTVAEQFYTRALDVIKEVPMKNVVFYYKSILVNLLHLYCVQGELDKARKYHEECLSVKCEVGILPLLFMEGEIRLLLLENKEIEALHKIDNLIKKLIKSKEDAFLLKSIYLNLMEFLLLLKREENATWCLKQLDTLYKNADQDIMIKIQELHVQYAILFGHETDELYETFYETILKGEMASKISTRESFKSLISLYETEKEQNLMLKKQASLQVVADIDELTKIYNRRYSSKVISKLIQDDGTLSIGYVMVDIDFFKEYNDYYGHSKGDEVIKEVANLLKKNLPDNAFTARYGGDEFTCIFVDRSDDEIITFVKSVQKELKDKNIVHLKSKNSKQLTLSFGIYNEMHVHGCDELTLIKKADLALYQSKKKGRNVYTIYKQRS